MGVKYTLCIDLLFVCQKLHRIHVANATKLLKYSTVIRYEKYNLNRLSNFWERSGGTLFQLIYSI